MDSQILNISSNQQKEQEDAVQYMDDDGLKFQTPGGKHMAMDSGNTRETEVERESQSQTASKKKSPRKQIKGKNFIEQNKRIQTRYELFSQFSEKTKIRASEINSKQSQYMHTSTYSSRFQTSQQKKTNQRQADWQKINQKNQLLSSTKPSQTGQKNASKDYVIKHIEVDINKLMDQRSSSQSNLGGTFSKNRREKWYHMTNSSSITNLRSYQSMDVPLGQEDKAFPTTKGNQTLKRSVNRSQVFDRSVISYKNKLIFKYSFLIYQKTNPLIAFPVIDQRKKLFII